MTAEREMTAGGSRSVERDDEVRPHVQVIFGGQPSAPLANSLLLGHRLAAPGASLAPSAVEDDRDIRVIVEAFDEIVVEPSVVARHDEEVASHSLPCSPWRPSMAHCRSQPRRVARAGWSRTARANPLIQRFFTLSLPAQRRRGRNGKET